MKLKRDNNIDVIVPAYKAHGTIVRTLCSIAEQTIIDDLHVVIVNDCCPESDYSYFVKMFEKFMDIKEVKLSTNGGPGVARQKGIDESSHEFFTCIDADDTFTSAIALEVLRDGINEVAMIDGKPTNDVYMCASSTFLQMGDDAKHIVTHKNDMVWMFGKLYRRSFINKYAVHFNTSRANEDTGFNTIVKLLCDNTAEQIRYMQEATYMWHNNENSITRINDNQYSFDQCMCGWTDNMIYALQHVQAERPFSGTVMQWSVNVMLELYYYYIECCAKKPVFAAQQWQYVKKYYHTIYKQYESMINDKAFGKMFSIVSTAKWGSGKLVGVLPTIGIKEFINKLRIESYNEDDLYDIWQRIPIELRQNNVDCGVCKAKYWERKEATHAKEMAG